MPIYLANNASSINIGTVYKVESGKTVPIKSAYQVNSGVTSSNMLENGVLYKKGGSASLFDYPTLKNENVPSNYASQYFDATFGNVTRENTSSGIHLSHEFLGTASTSEYSKPLISIHSVNKIKTSKYSKLNVELENINITFNGTFGGGYIFARLTNNVPEGSYTNVGLISGMASKYNMSRSEAGTSTVYIDSKTLTIDISSMSEDAYLVIYQQMEFKNGCKDMWDFYITKIWLE